MTKECDQIAGPVALLRRQMGDGTMWTQRRDAAEGLMLAARAALCTLREGASDDDPDVSAFCEKALKTIDEDTRKPPSQLDLELQSFLPSDIPDAPEDATEAPATDGGPTDRFAAEALLREAAGDIGATSVETTSRGLKIELSLGSRSQKVYVEFGRQDQEKRDIVLLYTLCGPATPDRYEWALKSNARLTYGALALTRLGEERMLILVETRALSAVRRESLASSLKYIARAGDLVESQLMEEDRH